MAISGIHFACAERMRRDTYLEAKNNNNMDGLTVHKLKNATSIIAVVVFTGMMPPGIHATTYYVDEGHPSASDSNPGTEAWPWFTLQHAADSVTPGDTVIVMPGSYEDVSFSTSGTSDAWIAFLGVSTSGVIIRGAMEYMAGASYLSISNFTVRDYSVWGVFLRGDNHHITMNGLHVAGGGAGIHLTYGYQGQDPLEGPVSDVLLENLLIEGCTYSGIDCTPGPCDRVVVRDVEVRDMGSETFWGADGIAFERGAYITVEECYVHDNAGDGIDIGSRDHNGYVDGIVVRRNRVVRNRSNGIKVWAGGRIENNLVWGQGNTSCALGAFPGTYVIVNNTIAYNMWDPEFGLRNYAFVVAWPDNETGISAACDVTLVNNIFAYNCNDDHGGPTGLYLGEGVTLVSEGHNVYWSREDGEIQADFIPGGQWFSREMIADGTWAAATGQGVGNVTNDPDFVSGWPDADLQLQSSSPAIDAGLTITESDEDIDGNSRPSGSRYDIGCYEMWQGFLPPAASFAGSPRDGQGESCSVHFTDLSSGDITGWSWSFGDGGTSTDQHPSHAYDCGGPFTVTLTVYGPGGGDSETKSDYISCDCPCGISVVSPAGGQIWCSGEGEDLRWISQYTSGNVRIRYSDNGGSTWHTVVNSTPDDGHYVWTVPQVTSANCLVRICDLSDPGCCQEGGEAFRICACERIELATGGMLEATAGCAYGETLEVSGGCPPYTWSVISGRWPDGVDLDMVSGVVSGAPAEVGSFTCTVEVSDVRGGSGQNAFTLEVGEYIDRKTDANGDCRTDILDVMTVVNVILELARPTPAEMWRSDCNGALERCEGDGVINILDALKIVHLILGTDTCP